MALLLTGCIRLGVQPAAPVSHYGLHGGAGSAGAHTASAGDTLWGVAQRYRLALYDLIAVNHLQPPYNLRPGQRLKLPPPRTYRTRPGDTLYNVSRTFGVSQTALARINGLGSPYAVRPGQVLRIPGVASPARKTAARQFLPGREMFRFPGQVDSEPVEPEPLPPPPAVVASVTRDLPERARPGGKFIWPVEGRVISSYGPKKDGLHNDGINIRSARGAPVRAAENGVVVYADDKLEGFGNLVLVKHADRWVTAYAHLSRVLVRRGDKVAIGQAIGSVGSTGLVSEPQLHFEIRRGTDALNPLIYLPERGA